MCLPDHPFASWVELSNHAQAGSSQAPLPPAGSLLPLPVYSYLSGACVETTNTFQHTSLVDDYNVAPSSKLTLPQASTAALSTTSFGSTPSSRMMASILNASRGARARAHAVIADPKHCWLGLLTRSRVTVPPNGIAGGKAGWPRQSKD